MKKILTVSFVALISVISAGNAAIPDKTYVDDTAAQKVDVAQDVANAIMITDESGNVVASTEVAEVITVLANVPADIETLGNAVKVNENAIGARTNLTTTDKSSLVAAVNEVRTETGSVAAQASELSAKVDNLVDKDAELTALVGTNAEQIELQGTQIVAQGESITGLGDRLGTAESDISTLKTDKVNKTDLGDLAYQDKLTNNFVDDAAIAQSKIAGLTDALAAKVDDSQVIAEAGTVTNADAEIPTIARMNAAIANAKPDTSGLVGKAAVVVSGGTHTMTGATVANDANKDTYVPTVAYVQQMAELAAGNAVDEMNAKFQEYVPYDTEIADGFLVTDATGNVYVNHGVPASITDAVDEKVSAKLNKPEGKCLTPGNCVLIFSGYTEDGEIALVWEKVARSISDVQAE